MPKETPREAPVRRVTLALGGGTGATKTFVLRAGEVLRIGRGPANDFVLALGGVSTCHAELFLRDADVGPCLFIRDTSKNGTALKTNAKWQPMPRGGRQRLEDNSDLLLPYKGLPAGADELSHTMKVQITSPTATADKDAHADGLLETAVKAKAPPRKARPERKEKKMKKVRKVRHDKQDTTEKKEHREKKERTAKPRPKFGAEGSALRMLQKRRLESGAAEAHLDQLISKSRRQTPEDAGAEADAEEQAEGVPAPLRARVGDPRKKKKEKEEKKKEKKRKDPPQQPAADGSESPRLGYRSVPLVLHKRSPSGDPSPERERRRPEVIKLLPRRAEEDDHRQRREDPRLHSRSARPKTQSRRESQE